MQNSDHGNGNVTVGENGENESNSHREPRQDDRPMKFGLVREFTSEEDVTIETRLRVSVERTWGRQRSISSLHYVEHYTQVKGNQIYITWRISDIEDTMHTQSCTVEINRLNS